MAAPLRLHVFTPLDFAQIEALGKLAKTAPGGTTTAGVYLVRDPTSSCSFLMATNGVVVRSIRVTLLQMARETAAVVARDPQRNLADHYVPALLSGDDLPESVSLLSFADASGHVEGTTTWSFDLLPPNGIGALPSLVPTLTSHLRVQAPKSFQSWFFLMAPAALQAWANSFPEASQPPALWIPEVQPANGGTPWAKYWAYHARTGDPLGVVMGVRSPETLKRFLPQK